MTDKSRDNLETRPKNSNPETQKRVSTIETIEKYDKT